MEYCYIVVIKKAGAWGCWGGAILPVYVIWSECMYVSYISRFMVSSRPEIYSSYRPISPENWD